MTRRPGVANLSYSIVSGVQVPCLFPRSLLVVIYDVTFYFLSFIYLLFFEDNYWSSSSLFSWLGNKDYDSVFELPWFAGSFWSPESISEIIRSFIRFAGSFWALNPFLKL